MPIEFNVNPYNDDFEADNGPRENNYMRILFKPGYAVQARELTQLQTAIQNQIKLFGDHIFEDGSQVIGGHLTYDNAVISLKLQNQYANTDIDITEFDKEIITNDVGAVQNKKARVIAVDDTQEYKTLMIRYVRGVKFDDNDDIKVVPGNSPKAKLLAVGSANVGSVVSINEGVFYVNGFFVSVPEQTIVLDPYSSKPTYRIGLEIEETIIDDSADSSLLDPAQDSFNYQAPGADRYQFSLVLAKRTLDSLDDSSFFELLRIEDGKITKQVKYPVYSEIEKTLARRTFDESGNYTVYPFRASASDVSGDDTIFNVNIEPGKAYVQGFEFETVGTTSIPVGKARTTSSVSDYDLSLEFGNYITVNNFFGANSGIFDTTNFASLDMHIVPTANIDTTSATTYNRTLAGTARARSLQRNSGTKLDLFIIDQNMSTNTFNVAATSNSTAFTFPAAYPIDPVGLYNGIAFRVTAGTGSGQERRIVSYDASRVATVDRAFDTNLDTSSQVTLNYAIKDVDSITVRPTSYAASVYGAKSSSTAFYPSMDVDSLSKSSEGDTFLSRTNFNRLLFSLPETYVSDSGFSDVDFVHRKLITNQSFNASGELTVALSGKEKFYYGTDGSYLSNSNVEENFLVIVRDKQSSSFSNGQLLSLSTVAANGIYRINDGQVTIEAGAGGGAFRGDIFFNVKIEDASDTPSIVKAKTLKGNKTSISDVDYTHATLSVTGETGTKIDSGNGVVWFTNYSDINTTPGDKQSLYISDVIKINKIYDSGNVLHTPNATNATDITDRYLFETGQRDNYYDHGTIILKDGKTPPVGQTAVLLTYFEHTNPAGGGFFSAASYSLADIANNYVGVYSSSTVGTTFLADAIDFRPRRTDGTTAFSFVGYKLPYTNESMELSYAYYVPRIDKVVATSNKEFKIVPGIPEKYPKPPADVPNTMTLYTMFVPPYTRKAIDVKFKFHENRRYTMRDIGRIDKRVERLEYYTQLSLLEQQARDEAYLYEDRLTEKEKYGILVEQFDGFNIADTKNPDLLCHISFNSLKPYKSIKQIDLNLVSSSGNFRKTGRAYSLNYTEEPIISQNTATKATTVQPYMFGSYNDADITLRPEFDNWISETYSPAVVTTDTIDNQTVNFAETIATATQEVAEAAARDTTAETGETINHVGFNNPVFNTESNDSATVDAIVDAVAGLSALNFSGIFPVSPIGDLSGLSQWSLAISGAMGLMQTNEVQPETRNSFTNTGNRTTIGSGAGTRFRRN